MKTKLMTVFLAALFLGISAAPSRAEDRSFEIAADVIAVRPGCLLATAAGSVIFVASLPFGLLSKSVKKTAHTLVVVPAQAAFTRPVGDMDSLMWDF